MNSICSVGGDSSIADEVSDVLNSLSPSELNDIDSEDEEDTTKDYDSDEDLQVANMMKKMKISCWMSIFHNLSRLTRKKPGVLAQRRRGTSGSTMSRLRGPRAR